MLNTSEVSPELIQHFLTLSAREFEEKSWGVSKQYLEVVEPIVENGIPIIVRIDKEDDGFFAVHFPIKDERFFYTHYFSADSAAELKGIDITPASTLLLRVVSENINLDDMLPLTTIIASESWQKGKGSPKRRPDFVHKTSGFDFKPDTNRAGNVEKKLIQLLNSLESHEGELHALTSLGCQLFVDIYWEAYINNSIIGGFYLNKEIITKLNKLNVEISFDISVTGEAFN